MTGKTAADGPGNPGGNRKEKPQELLVDVLWIRYFLDPDPVASQPYRIHSGVPGTGTTSNLEIGSK